MRPLDQLRMPADPSVIDLLPRVLASLEVDDPAPLLPLAADGRKYAVPLVPLPSGLALVIGTSGSTGSAKLAMLTAANVRAAVAATHSTLGGEGLWLLALAPHHIAGFQVLVRSVLAGTTPVVMDMRQPFTAAGFAAAVAGMPDAARRYVSLVPAQVARLLGEPIGMDALRSFDAVLVGGAALPAPLRERLVAAGVRLVTTYGMSETGGGCVYDGRPLTGVTVTLDADGRIVLGGPMVAAGYLGDREATAAAFGMQDGQRVFRTDDLGRLEAANGAAQGAAFGPVEGSAGGAAGAGGAVEGSPGDGSPILRVVGRIDDVVNTGGLKVAPALVEEAVLRHVTGVVDCVVVGTPDPEFGEAVSLALVMRDGIRPNLADVRTDLRDVLAAHALPRRLALVSAIPRLAVGKPDRDAVRRLWAPV